MRSIHVTMRRQPRTLSFEAGMRGLRNHSISKRKNVFTGDTLVNGLEANRTWERGETVFEDHFESIEARARTQSVQIAKREHGIHFLLSLLNHHCDPNVLLVIEGTSFKLIANKRIDPGDILTADYRQFETGFTRAEFRALSRDIRDRLCVIFDKNSRAVSSADRISRRIRAVGSLANPFTCECTAAHCTGEISGSLATEAETLLDIANQYRDLGLKVPILLRASLRREQMREALERLFYDFSS